MRPLSLLLSTLLLGACSSLPQAQEQPPPATVPAATAAESIADAVPEADTGTGAATDVETPPAKTPASPVLVAEGRASFYGAKFHGRRTASGEPFNKHAMTAAHRTLPFGTRVRVTHLGNGRSVDLVINDRGPFTGGRIIDVSRAAAEALGMVQQGVARVRVERLP